MLKEFFPVIMEVIMPKQYLVNRKVECSTSEESLEVIFIRGPLLIFYTSKNPHLFSKRRGKKQFYT